MLNSSIVSSCEQTRSNALSPTFTRFNNTETDNNGIDKRTTSVGSKSSDKVASNHKPNNDYDGITNAQVSGFVHGIEPKESTQEVTVRLYTSSIRRRCGLERKLKGT